MSTSKHLTTTTVFAIVLLSLCSSVLAQTCTSLPSGIVGWWTADDAANDSMGQNNGIPMGGMTYGPGAVGQSFFFHGTGDAIELGNSPTFALQNFTIETWFKRDSTSYTTLDVGYGATFLGYNEGGYSFGLNDAGDLYLSNVGSSGVFAGTQVTDLNWHHAAVTKSGSAVVFYLDGIAYAKTYFTTFSFTSNVAIGGRGNDYLGTFIGGIDELTLYNRALSQSEIQLIFGASTSGKCKSPFIRTHPSNQSAPLGGSATFTVVASGLQPLSYQWQFNGTNIDGAIASAFTVYNVTTNDLGSYRVAVSNDWGSVTSDNATLALLTCSGPLQALVSWWSADVTTDDFCGTNHGVLTGDASYTAGKIDSAFNFDGAGDMVSLGNPTNLQLQNFTFEMWLRRNNSDTVTTSPDSTAVVFGHGLNGYALLMRNDGSFLLNKIGDGAVSSPSFKLTDASVFHHIAVTKSNTTVAFYLDGVAYPGADYTRTFSFANPVAIGARSDDSGNGFLGQIDELSVYNRGLSAAEVQTLYSGGTTYKCRSPFIFSQPASRSVGSGTNVTFTVGSSGATPRYLQWRRDGANLADATNATLTLTNVQVQQAGNYTVVVSNALGTVSSSIAQLIVNEPPVITNQPQDVVAVAGTTSTFTVGASGSAPLSYQWQKSQTDLINATNAILQITNTSLSDAGIYRVIVSNSVGFAISSNASLSFNPLIQINGQAGSSFTYTNTNSVTVSISTTFSGGSIFYTLDGSTPDFSSTSYAGPFALSQSATIRAIAYDPSFNSAQTAPVSVTLWFMYSLTVTNPGGGNVTLSPTGGVYRNDQTVQATAVASNGWTFIGWQGDVSGTNSIINIPMEKNKVIKPVFATPLTLVANANGTFSVNQSSTLCSYGSTVQISAIPNAGYFLALWGGSASGATNPYPLVVTAPNPSVSALFSTLATNRFALTVIPNGNGTIDINPRANSFSNGQVVAISATATGTNRFLMWSGDVTGKSNNVNVTMNKSKLITANFTGGDYPIRFNSVGSSNGSLQFSFTGEPERKFNIESSASLTNWAPFMTLSNSTGTVQFSDVPSTNPPRKFYRATIQ